MNDDALTRAEELVLRATDGALTPDEARELERLAADDPALEATLLAHRELGLGLDALGHRLRADAALEPRADHRVDRAVIRIGFTLLFGGGALLMLGVAIRALAELGPSPIGLGLGAAGLGAALLLARSVVLRLRRPDPYEVIER